eukprot:262002-Amphidinium_carterae.1
MSNKAFIGCAETIKLSVNAEGPGAFCKWLPHPVVFTTVSVLLPMRFINMQEAPERECFKIDTYTRDPPYKPKLQAY